MNNLTKNTLIGLSNKIDQVKKSLGIDNLMGFKHENGVVFEFFHANEDGNLVDITNHIGNELGSYEDELIKNGKTFLQSNVDSVLIIQSPLQYYYR